MGLFVDRVVLQLSDPARLLQVLTPAGDTAPTRIRRLVDAVYAFPFATLHDVLAVTVSRVEAEHPFFPPQRVNGTWTQTIPSHRLTDVAYERTSALQALWVDLAAELQMKLVLEVDAGEITSVLTHEVTDFNTLDEFRARFPFLDVNGLLARYNITTVEELRAHYHFLLSEIRLHPPGPFDPTDPANQFPFSLRVAALVRDDLDVRGALREAKQLRAALEQTTAYRRDLGPAEARTPFAPLVILPEAALAGLPFTAETLSALFGAEGILVLFLTPT
jgi:hypothetical protein